MEVISDAFFFSPHWLFYFSRATIFAVHQVLHWPADIKSYKYLFGWSNLCRVIVSKLNPQRSLKAATGEEDASRDDFDLGGANAVGHGSWSQSKILPGVSHLMLHVKTKVAACEEEGLLCLMDLFWGWRHFHLVAAPPTHPALLFTKKIPQRLANSCDSFTSSPASYARRIRLIRLCRNPELNPALFSPLHHKIWSQVWN